MSGGTAVRTLVLMRHAKSDWSGDEPDLRRPLAARGRRQAGEAGAWLSANLPALDFVVTSPATRARSTWEVAGASCEHTPIVSTDERIYTMESRDLIAVLRDIDNDIDSTLMVGHNPGLDELVARLTGSQVDMVTSALAVLRFEGSWRGLSKGSCALTAFGRPPG